MDNVEAMRAAQQLVAFLTAANAGSPLSLSQAIEKYTRHLHASGYAASTIEGYCLSLKLLALYARERAWPSLLHITTDHLEDYLVYVRTRKRWFGKRGRRSPKPVSDSHVETQFRRIQTFFNWCLQRRLLLSNPMLPIKHPFVVKRVVETIPLDAQVRMLSELERVAADREVHRSERFRAVRNKAALLMLIDTPSRRNEIASLALGHVDSQAGRVKVLGKGRKERYMPIGAAAARGLRSYLALRSALRPRSKDLWVTPRGEPMNPVWLYKMLSRLGRRAGAPGVHTHQFRHTFTIAVLDAPKPIPLPVLEDIAGWESGVPETYLRTVRQIDAAKYHNPISPADRLVRAAGEI